ncbi:hypothetical protein HOY82DRAFT_597338 [Tuber indicum]|nr:hypothetical protein HOY82DRAFT_597338 [Tuber indicum]
MDHTLKLNTLEESSTLRPESLNTPNRIASSGTKKSSPASWIPGRLLRFAFNGPASGSEFGSGGIIAGYTDLRTLVTSSCGNIGDDVAALPTGFQFVKNHEASVLCC